MLKKCAWAALAATLAACKSGASAPAAAVSGTCATDAECAAHFRCDLGLRRCVCTSDEACPGQFCNAFTGLCVASVAGCASNSACASGQYCDTALRTCKPITAFCHSCKVAAECGAGSACAAHPDFPAAGTFCVPACSGGSCAAGLSCKSGNCFPAAACGNSNACFPDSLKPCAADADCGDAGQTCDQTLKACVARNRTCPAGDACDPQSKLCVHACASDQDCVAIEHGTGYQCRANACFRRNICSQDADCSSGQVCQSNPDGSKSCAVGCVTASDCPLGQGCDTTTNPSHPHCAAGCTQNADCALNTICSGGRCVSTYGSCAQACQTNMVCPIGGNCVNNCCVEPNLFTLCGATGCAACTPGNGCPVDCAHSCYPVVLGPCPNGFNDCANKFGAISGIVCSGGQCQVSANLSVCSQDSDCPYKGFKCFPGACGNSVCEPFESAAGLACARGHP